MANSGEFRCKDVVIRKYDSGGAPVAGYPQSYSMVDATTFVYAGGGAVAVTDVMIAEMIQGAVGDGGTWLDLVDEFRTWVEGQEITLAIQSDQINLSYGVDLITCPISHGDYF